MADTFNKLLGFDSKNQLCPFSLTRISSTFLYQQLRGKSLVYFLKTLKQSRVTLKITNYLTQTKHQILIDLITS